MSWDRKAMVDAMADMLVAVDEGDVVTFVNQQLQDDLDLPAGGVVGRPVLGLAPEIGPLLGELRRTGQIRDRDVDFVGADGRPRSRSVNGSVVGQSQALVLVARDMTAVRQAETRYRDVLNAAQDEIVLAGPDGTLLDVNDFTCANLGYTREELLGLSVHDIQIVADFELLRQTLVARGTAIVEGRHRRKDGSSYPVETHVSMLDRPGGPLLIAVARDTSDRVEAEAERTRLVEELLTAQDGWRRQIARELHDELGQVLTSVSVGLKALENTASDERTREQSREMRQLTEQSVDEVRRITRGLHPMLLDELGLVAAVQRYGADTLAPAGVELEVQVEGMKGGERLGPQVEASLFRVLQEAITNVVRHADAGRASIVVHRRADSIRCMVEDDGVGMALPGDGRLPTLRGLGLVGMRERLQMLGGRLTLESEPGGGTTVYIELPLTGGGRSRA